MIQLWMFSILDKGSEPDPSCSSTSVSALTVIDAQKNICGTNQQTNKTLFHYFFFGNYSIKKWIPHLQELQKNFPILKFPEIQTDKIFPF